MSDTIKIATKADLQNIVIGGEALRFVVENKAWYYSDPNASDASDGESIIVPNVGTGRWFKSSANVSSILASNVVSHNLSNIVMINNTHYLVDMSTATANCELTLPASSTLGDFIEITLINPSTTYRLIIKNASNTINGNNSDYAYIKNFTLSKFQYAGGINWVVDNPSVFKYTISPTFIRPVDATVQQDGILQYLGTQYNTQPYNTPFNSAAGNPQKINTFANRTAGTRSLLANKVQGGATSVQYYNNGGVRRTIGIAFYDTGTNTPLPVRMSDVYIEWLPTFIGQNVYFPTSIAIYGIKYPEKFSWSQVMSDSSTSGSTTTFGLLESGGSPMRINTTKEYINTIDLSAYPLEDGYYINTTDLSAHILPVNSTEYYPIYLFEPFHTNTSTVGFALHQLEFYGDIII